MDSLVRNFLDERALRAGQQTQDAAHVKGHLHQTEAGLWVRCYHRCRTSIRSPGFWIGLTVGFFPEHYLWEKVPPFSLLTKLAGL